MSGTSETHEQLARQVVDMSGVSGPNRQVILAISKQILSNARLESAIVDFSKSTTKTEKEMRDLAKAQVWLGIAAVVVAIILAIAFGA